ncbi:hypothetical protein KR222_010029 [Zaprionus bogoriensis]|nr:hypothetical protein KR222_010029 [Zaprionus bogoriensis]
MAFTAQFKRKRKTNQNNAKQSAPFPPCDEATRYQGIFNGLCVEVSDSEQAPIRQLHDNGGYGKGSLSRGGPASGSATETLLLGLEEACLLAYFLDVLQISHASGDVMAWTEYLHAALDYEPEFLLKLAAYLYLKARNWTVHSGIKFGGDFLIYKQGPAQYHASFLVIMQAAAQAQHAHYLPRNLKGVQRVAETSDKDVLLLRVQQPDGFAAAPLATQQTLQALTIDETVVRRFNYTSFVQSKQRN